MTTNRFAVRYYYNSGFLAVGTVLLIAFNVGFVYWFFLFSFFGVVCFCSVSCSHCCLCLMVVNSSCPSFFSVKFLLYSKTFHFNIFVQNKHLYSPVCHDLCIQHDNMKNSFCYQTHTPGNIV